MNTEPKKTPYKIIFDHGEYCEIENAKGELRRYTHNQVEALKLLMPEFHFQTIVFRDYSMGPMKAEQFAHT